MCYSILAIFFGTKGEHFKNSEEMTNLQTPRRKRMKQAYMTVLTNGQTRICGL